MNVVAMLLMLIFGTAAASLMWFVVLTNETIRKNGFASIFFIINLLLITTCLYFAIDSFAEMLPHTIMMDGEVFWEDPNPTY